eukprot:m.449351 g.449351  ORF g.449351 m.449351 type:complete len:335 (-) comp19805_c0_seq1:91-1095(-)
MADTAPVVAGDAWVQWKVEKRKSAQPFDFEEWYSLLEDVTPRSVVFDLTVETAQAMEAAYRANYNSGRALEPIEIELLVALETQIDDSLAEIPAKGYFVRLASRSPKDAALFSRQELDACAERLAAAEPAGPGDEAGYEANLRLRAFCELSIQTLRITTGKDAVKLLLSSERVFRDLIEALTARAECNFSQKMVIREWCEQLDQEFEFRAFVYNNTLTALSQYNHMVHFPEQVKQRETLLQRITQFWEAHVRDKLKAKYVHYIVDFAVLRNGQVIVIELNPFDNATGAGLYDWGSERDLAVLEGRAGPADLVLAQAPPPNQAMMNEVLEGELQG